MGGNSNSISVSSRLRFRNEEFDPNQDGEVDQNELEALAREDPKKVGDLVSTVLLGEEDAIEQTTALNMVRELSKQYRGKVAFYAISVGSKVLYSDEERNQLIDILSVRVPNEFQPLDFISKLLGKDRNFASDTKFSSVALTSNSSRYNELIIKTSHGTKYKIYWNPSDEDTGIGLIFVNVQKFNRSGVLNISIHSTDKAYLELQTLKTFAEKYIEHDQSSGALSGPVVARGDGEAKASPTQFVTPRRNHISVGVSYYGLRPGPFKVEAQYSRELVSSGKFDVSAGGAVGIAPAPLGASLHGVAEITLKLNDKFRLGAAAFAGYTVPEGPSAGGRIFVQGWDRIQVGMEGQYVVKLGDDEAGNAVEDQGFIGVTGRAVFDW